MRGFSCAIWFERKDQADTFARRLAEEHHVVPELDGRRARVELVRGKGPYPLEVVRLATSLDGLIELE